MRLAALSKAPTARKDHREAPGGAFFIQVLCFFWGVSRTRPAAARKALTARNNCHLWRALFEKTNYHDLLAANSPISTGTNKRGEEHLILDRMPTLTLLGVVGEKDDNDEQWHCIAS